VRSSPHAVEEYQQIEDVASLGAGSCCALACCFTSAMKAVRAAYSSPGGVRVGRFFRVDALRRVFVGFGKRLHSGEDVRFGCVGLRCAEFCCGKGEKRPLAVGARNDDVRGEMTRAKEFRLEGPRGWLVLIAVRAMRCGQSVRNRW